MSDPLDREQIKRDAENVGGVTEGGEGGRGWLRRRWLCFREGHEWQSPLPFGADQCKRCGKLVEW